MKSVTTIELTVSQETITSSRVRHRRLQEFIQLPVNSSSSGACDDGVGGGRRGLPQDQQKTASDQ